MQAPFSDFDVFKNAWHISMFRDSTCGVLCALVCVRQSQSVFGASRHFALRLRCAGFVRCSRSNYSIPHFTFLKWVKKMICEHQKWLDSARMGGVKTIKNNGKYFNFERISYKYSNDREWGNLSISGMDRDTYQFRIWTKTGKFSAHSFSDFQFQDQKS